MFPSRSLSIEVRHHSYILDRTSGALHARGSVSDRISSITEVAGFRCRGRIDSDYTRRFRENVRIRCARTRTMAVLPNWGLCTR